MGLRLSAAQSAALDDLSPELRVAAEALGGGLADQLVDLGPSLTRGLGDEAALDHLTLDREPEPDPLSLAACLAAHRAYLARRGQTEAISAGALAIARLLVWAARAALIGAAPRVVWIGPGPRCPDPGAGQHRINSDCRLEGAEGAAHARAAALVTPAGDAPPGS